MSKNEMIYVSAPYNDKYYHVMCSRYVDVNRYVGLLLSRGYCVYSPVSFWHPVRVQCRMEEGNEFWNEINATYMKNCDTLHILALSGWQESEDIGYEIQLAISANIPIYVIDPITFTSVSYFSLPTSHPQSNG